MPSSGEHPGFDRKGGLCLPSALAAKPVASMGDRVREALAQVPGVRRDAPETWTLPRPAPAERGGEIARDPDGTGSAYRTRG